MRVLTIERLPVVEEQVGKSKEFERRGDVVVDESLGSVPLMLLLLLALLCVCVLCIGNENEESKREMRRIR